MERKDRRIIQGSTHDFFFDRPQLFATVGYLPSENPATYLYRAWIFLLLLYLQMVSAYAAYLNKHEKVTMINAVHTFLVPFFGTVGLAARILTYRSLTKSWEMAKAGIYHYNNEDLDEEQVRMKEKILSEVRKKSVITLAMFTTAACWNMVCLPLAQLATLAEEEGDHSQDLVNPYLPIVIYTPFSTRNVLGYSAAYLMGVLLFLYVYGGAICTNEIFVSCTVQLKVHMKILNHSIRNIQRRAYVLYRKGNKEPQRDISKENLFITKEFQNCLYSCLKANIQHHQALLRFRKEFQPFGGASLFDLLTVGCIAYASIIYLSFQFQRLPATLLVNYVVTLLAELAYPYCNCLFGEEVIEECSNMFEDLYGMPWIHCNKRFNKALNIVMTKSLEPIKIHALIIKASASLGTYGDLITGAYKAANLLRQSDRH